MQQINQKTCSHLHQYRVALGSLGQASSIFTFQVFGHLLQQSWAVSAHLAHVQASEKTPRHNASTICSSDPGMGHQVLQSFSNGVGMTVFLQTSKPSKCTPLKRLRDSKCLNFWGEIAKIKSEGSPSKAYACACAGCLAEELRPLTAHWLFPKLSKTPPWVPLVGMVHNGSPPNRLLVRQMHKLDQIKQINPILDKNV